MFDLKLTKALIHGRGISGVTDDFVTNGHWLIRRSLFNHSVQAQLRHNDTRRFCLGLVGTMTLTEQAVNNVLSIPSATIRVSPTKLLVQVRSGQYGLGRVLLEHDKPKRDMVLVDDAYISPFLDDRSSPHPLFRSGLKCLTKDASSVLFIVTMRDFAQYIYDADAEATRTEKLASGAIVAAIMPIRSDDEDYWLWDGALSVKMGKS